MGKKGGSAPAAPDPYEVARAQGAANKEAVLASANVNRYTQETPYGTVSWENRDPNSEYGDWVQRTALDSADQWILDRTRDVGGSLVAGALERIGQVDRGPFDISDHTGTWEEMQADIGHTAAARPDIQNQLSNTSLPQALTSARNGPQVAWQHGVSSLGVNDLQSDVDQSGVPALRDSIDTSGIPNYKDYLLVEPGTQMTGGINDQGLPGLASAIDTSNLAGMQTVDPNSLPAMQENVNMGGLIGLQGAVDQNGLPSIQTGLDFAGVNDLPGVDDFSAERGRVEDAVYGRHAARLDPRFEEERRSLETKLANQGIPVGSEAWTAEMERFDRSRNDAYAAARSDAITSGGTEQSRMFGLGMAAHQAGVNDAAMKGNFANQAQSQGFNQSLAGANLANLARSQQFGERMGEADFANQARAQKFGENVGAANLANQVNAQGFAQNLAQSGLTNDARGQEFARELAKSQFQNQANSQGFSQGMARSNLANDAIDRMNAQRLAEAGFENTANDQGFSQAMARAGLNNMTSDTAWNRNLGNAQLSNAARAMSYGENLQNAQLQNQARNQLFNERLTQGNFQNAAAAQDDARMNNILNAAFAGRQQQLNEALTERQMPMNELAAILQGTPAFQSPVAANQPAYQVAPANYAGAIQNNYNNQMAQWQAQQAQGNAMMGGLFSLGSAVVGAPWFGGLF